MKKLGIGCSGLIALVVLLGIIGAIVGKPPNEQRVSGEPGASAQGNRGTPELPTLGQTATKGGWEVTLTEFGPYADFAARLPATAPQGKLLVVGFVAKNLQNRTSNFTTNDFELRAADGRRFRPSGHTGTISGGFVVSQSVQPGLSTENRLVFDVDPSVTDFTLQVLGLQFGLSSE